jgi:hypothetical protein
MVIHSRAIRRNHLFLSNSYRRVKVEEQSQCKKNIWTKANKLFGILHRNRNICSTPVMEQTYKSLIRPAPEHALSAWDAYNKVESDQVKMMLSGS